MFDSTPLEKWQEIIRHASPTLVGLELESLLERLAGYELLLEKQGVRLDSSFESLRATQELQERRDSLAIESMARILSNHE